MKMDKMLKECMRPHPALHYVAGAGIGFLVLYFVPSLIANLLVLGLVLLVGAFVLEFFVNPAKK